MWIIIVGLLKWKEKKEIDIQIDEKKKIIADLESVVTAQKNNQQSECNIKIKEINKQIKPGKDRLINIQKRLNEINKELTKER